MVSRILIRWLFFFIVAIVLTLVGVMPGWDATGIARAQTSTAPTIAGTYVYIATVNEALNGTYVAGFGSCEADGLGNATCDPFFFNQAGGGGQGSVSIVFTTNANGTGTFQATSTLPDGSTVITTSRFVITAVDENNVAVGMFGDQNEPAGASGTGILTSSFELSRL